MQQSELFKQSPALCFVPVLITLLVLVVFFRGTAVFKKKLRQEAAGLGHPGKRSEIVHESVSEAENDILSLAASFLTVQVCRFAITGRLPNEEGLEEPRLAHLSSGHVAALGGMGFAFVIASIAMARVRSMLVRRSHSNSTGHVKLIKPGEGPEEEGIAVRIAEVVMDACAKCFAWCSLMSARWAWMLYPVLGIDVHTIDGRIMLALILSLLTFIVVYLLDKVDDALHQSSSDTETAEHAVLSIIGAVSVLVGFTWEHSFDGAVTAVADLNHGHPRLTKFVLGICVFFFLYRPWRRYILRRALQLQDLKKDREMALAAKEQTATH